MDTSVSTDDPWSGAVWPSPGGDSLDVSSRAVEGGTCSGVAFSGPAEESGTTKATVDAAGNGSALGAAEPGLIAESTTPGSRDSTRSGAIAARNGTISGVVAGSPAEEPAAIKAALDMAGSGSA
jgi:hypothetical protein